MCLLLVGNGKRLLKRWQKNKKRLRKKIDELTTDNAFQLRCLITEMYGE